MLFKMLERLREDYSSSCTFVESTRSATEIELTRVHNYVPRIASTATVRFILLYVFKYDLTVFDFFAL